jgi:uncharacterized protein YxeA
MKKALIPLTCLAIAIIAAASLVAGCNSGDKNNVTDSTELVDSERQAISTDSDSVTVTLQTFRMTRQNFVDAFTSSRPPLQVAMIYFKPDVRNNYTLQAYGANGDGEDLNALITLAPEPTGPTLTINPGEYGYEQQITLGNVRAFLNLSTGLDIPIEPAQFKTVVWLVPCEMTDANGEKLVYYQIIEPANVGTGCPDVPGTNRAGSISTNPSPPAKPCNDEPNGCYEAVLKKKYTKKELNAAKTQITN